MRSKKIKLVSNFKKFNHNSNFIFSAFNLAFIAYFFLKIIKPDHNFYLWCDGIIGSMHSESKKIPGYKLLNFFFKQKYSKIIVMGSYSKKQNIFLKKNFKTKVHFIKLPYVKESNIKNFAIKIKKGSLVLITLPTPKQEILANAIKKINKNFKVICIGGGLSIASGDIKKSPKFIQKIGLEFIWRLKNNPLRRIKRLIITILVYIVNMSNINKKINIIKS